jgi:hypothetical protein
VQLRRIARRFVGKQLRESPLGDVLHALDDLVYSAPALLAGFMVIVGHAARIALSRRFGARFLRTHCKLGDADQGDAACLNTQRRNASRFWPGLMRTSRVSLRSASSRLFTRRATMLWLSAAPRPASQTEQPWQEWVADFVYDRLKEFAEDAGKQTVQWLEELRRELELQGREIVQLREQVGFERGLRELRSEVASAKNEIPKMPAIVQRLEESHARLVGEMARTKEKLNNLRVDQSIGKHRLAELDKAAAARSKALELKVETTVSSLAMREIDPAAAAALRDFATETLESTRRDEKLWIFDPGLTVGTA